MEWVETTGRSIEEAKDAALDQLGVAEDDAEFEVVTEPKSGLFGRTRGEARVRARVQPTQARPKVERRGGQRKRRDPAKAGDKKPVSTVQEGSRSPAPPATDDVEAAPAARRRRTRTPQGSNEERGAAGAEEKRTDVEDASVEDQAAIIREFLGGLLVAFDLEAEIAEERIDDDTIELQVNGEELGLLVGPKGQTLQAIHELSRTIVQRKATGTHHGRVRVDVAGYRQRRREALERFAQQVAEDVIASGSAKALEPMHPADRKVVHDAINEIDGVRTTSEGEEPRRRVVISPADA